MVLKREVFVESQQRAREEIAGLRRELAGRGRLVKDDYLYAIERTAAESKLIEDSVLLYQSLGVPSDGTSKLEGGIAEP
ncbi:MAG: hypothetical protein QG666_351 [Euryarchaeota archaeon]|nr:hypothetical protein [Euryarchaeota archaeon]MDQ1313799.1 hypothetical protein [Euryarchaeota archaeon]